jgi:hypothetical protein
MHGRIRMVAVDGSDGDCGEEMNDIFGMAGASSPTPLSTPWPDLAWPVCSTTLCSLLLPNINYYLLVLRSLGLLWRHKRLDFRCQSRLASNGD